MENIDKLSIATLRSLIIDETNEAKSGHPGMALGSSPLMYTLYTKHISVNPKKPLWFNRDRFVLSAGHASCLLYSLFHLCGYDLSIEDVKNSRKLDSKTPGHPEFGVTPGVDATSGPLGQGIAQAVGMAFAERFVRNSYPDGEQIMNHYTYCLCGDGCLHEGISQEAISFAGHQKLNKLILFYDANQVTLDGPLSLSFTEDVAARFKASEWDVLEVKDGNDVDEIDKVIEKAKKSKEKPTLVIVHTVIGFGSANQGTNKVHGAPLGEEDGKHAKVDVYNFDHEKFFVPKEVYEKFNETTLKNGIKAYEKYEENFKNYAKKHPKEAKLFEKLMANDLSEFDTAKHPELVPGSETSTRVSSQKALNFFQKLIPNMIGGSADVAGSSMTKIEGAIANDPLHQNGHTVNFGIREFAMASIQNGMLLHGGTRPYTACFFVFSDYMKSAIRMSALTKLPSIYIFTHDSIMVGEDGPTHQPIEQLAMLRSIPNLNVIRPCDEREVYAAYDVALQSKETPTALVLSRQSLPLIPTSSEEGLKKGGYIVSKEQKVAQACILATGSEVSFALNAQKKLLEKGIDVRVVSLPCWRIFDKQTEEYKSEIIGVDYFKTVSVEILSGFGWRKYAGHVMSVDEFGFSGPGKQVMEKANFTIDNLVKLVEKII